MDKFARFHGLRYFICLAGWVNGVKNRGDYKISSDVIKEIREKSQLLRFNIGFGGSLFSGFYLENIDFVFFATVMIIRRLKKRLNIFNSSQLIPFVLRIAPWFFRYAFFLCVEKPFNLFSIRTYTFFPHTLQQQLPTDKINIFPLFFCVHHTSPREAFSVCIFFESRFIVLISIVTCHVNKVSTFYTVQSFHSFPQQTFNNSTKTPSSLFH